jgi:hypothetical protein
LKVETDADLGDYEWVEEGKVFREWLVPAALLDVPAPFAVHLPSCDHPWS